MKFLATISLTNSVENKSVIGSMLHATFKDLISFLLRTLHTTYIADEISTCVNERRTKDIEVAASVKV